MTVKYTDSVANLGGFGSFFKLLIKWRGSVYKVVWQDMLVYLVLYFMISLVYRFGLSVQDRDYFEKLVLHCSRFSSLIPVSFVLGFYVSLVVTRWWNTFLSIPWPDSAAVLACTYIPGTSSEARAVRNTVLRYINLTIAIIFADVSPVVRNELQTLKDYMKTEYGFLTDSELRTLERLDTDQHKAWVPLTWACSAIDQARLDGLIRTDLGQKTLVDEIIKVREKCSRLLGYSNFNIPLVYTQVVTIAVYSFFFFSVLGEQFLDPAQQYTNHTIDLYVPFFALLQLFFYIGWLKVAEALLNPFGADEHDIEFLDLLKRHLKMTKLVCDPVLKEEVSLPFPEVQEQQQEGAKMDNDDDDGHKQQHSQENNNIELVVVKSRSASVLTLPTITVINGLGEPSSSSIRQPLL